MAFEIDILITYADIDNETSQKNQIGWVTQFKKFLELMLYQVLGSKPYVLLKSEFDAVTSPQLNNAAVLVPIITRDFIQSGRCLDNLETFYKATADSKINRVFKVLKSPLTIQEQPPRLRDMIGYDMYQVDTETGMLKEYTDIFSQDAEKQYWMKLVDLAYDIHDALMILREGDTYKSEVKNIYRRKSIYLAESGHDISVQRNIIKRELQRYGYIVLPKNTLPTHAAEVERVIRRDLNDSSLSIHLVGSAYGEIPEGADTSIVDIQNRIAAEVSLEKRSKNQEFARLIWISQNLKNASDRQKSFIELLKRDTEAQEGAEILQNPLEDFKNIVREELMDSNERGTLDETGGRSIYLVHDKIDENEVRPFKEVIEKSGFKVLQPAFEGELLEVRKQHIDNLRNFDGAIIYKGKVNDQWVRMKVLDLLKAPGFGRKKPIKAKAILAAGNTNLEGFKNQNLTLISGDTPRSIENLINFLKEINP
jgi:hypothetical protein